MPLPNGNLTDDEFVRVREKLTLMWAKVGGRPPCRSCGEEGYFIHPALISNRSDTYAILSPHHTRQPTVMLYCKQCGLVEEYVGRLLGVEPLTSETPVEAE